MSRCPWTARPPRSSRATSTWTTSCSPARTPTRSLCSTLRKASALPPRPRTRTWPGCAKAEETAWRGRPRRRPRGRRADEQRTGPALHHGPSAQRGRRSAGSSGPRGRRSSRARGGAGLPLSAPPGRSRVRKCVAPPRAAAAATTADQRPTRRRRAPPGRGRAQEVERGAAQAIEETAAVAAEEGEHGTTCSIFPAR